MTRILSMIRKGWITNPDRPTEHEEVLVIAIPRRLLGEYREGDLVVVELGEGRQAEPEYAAMDSEA